MHHPKTGEIKEMTIEHIKQLATPAEFEKFARERAPAVVAALVKVKEAANPEAKIVLQFFQHHRLLEDLVKLGHSLVLGAESGLSKEESGTYAPLAVYYCPKAQRPIKKPKVPKVEHPPWEGVPLPDSEGCTPPEVTGDYHVVVRLPDGKTVPDTLVYHTGDRIVTVQDGDGCEDPGWFQRLLDLTDEGRPMFRKLPTDRVVAGWMPVPAW